MTLNDIYEKTSRYSILQAISRISNEYNISLSEREVLRARFVDELSYQKIAAELDIHVSAVHKRMGQVYKKIGIDGGKGKETKLRGFIESSVISSSRPEIIHKINEYLDSCPDISSKKKAILEILETLDDSLSQEKLKY